MTVSEDRQFQAVQDFHRLMDGEVPECPKAFTYQELLHRVDFKLEELLEMVHGTAESQEAFEDGVVALHLALDKAAQKIRSKQDNQETAPSLVNQVDALVDLLYLTYGSFVLMGVDPEPFFEIVHRANMGKIWPDGKAHHDPVTHKVLKPPHWEEEFAPEPKIREELERQLRLKANQFSLGKAADDKTGLH